MGAPTTLSVYWWLRRKRRNKKKELYKRSFNLIVDPVVLFYAGLFVIFCLFLGYEWLQRLLPLIESMGARGMNYLFYLPFVIFLGASIAANADPGIRFTSSELQLSLLPYSRKDLVLFLFLEKVGIQLLWTVFFVIVINLITTFPIIYLLLWGGIYVTSLSLSYLIQWRLFSLGAWVKFTTFIFIVSMAGLLYMGISGIVLNAVLTGYVLWLIFKSTEVSWGRVAEVNDAKVWNMWAISQMTNVHIRPPQRFGLTENYWQQKGRNDRNLSVPKMYERIWFGHLGRSFPYVWKTILTSLLLIIVIPTQVEWMLILTLPTSFLIYREVAVSVFGDFFDQENVFHALPPDEESSIGSYLKWAYVGMIPLFLGFLVIQGVLGMNIVGIAVQVACLFLWMIFDLNKGVRDRMNVIQKINFYPQETNRVVGYILVGAGVYYPWFMLALPVILMYERKIHKSALKKS